MSTPLAITVTGVIPLTGRLVFASDTLVRDSLTDSVMPPLEIVVYVTADVPFSVNIPSTDDPAFSPTGWTWEVRPHFPGWDTAFSVAIPYASPDGEIWFSELVEVPADGTAELYALVNHTHEGGGGGGGALPASTVVASTTYAQASAAGAATTYSRGDHRHGTPALPTPGAINAEVAGVAASLVATHAAGVNPHPIYLTQAEADALYATIGSGGGGGGSTLKVVRRTVTSGNLTLAGSTPWVAVPGGPTIAIAAVAGDYLEFQIASMLASFSTNFVDLAVIVGGTIVRTLSSGTATPASEGAPAFYGDGAFDRVSPLFEFAAEAGDISGGNVTVAFITKGSGGGTIYASTDYPLRWRALNNGPATVS